MSKQVMNGKAAPSQKTQSKGSKGNVAQGCLGCLGLLLVGMLAIVVISYFVVDDKGSNKTNTKTNSVSTFATAGQNAVIDESGGGALAAISEDKLDELTNYAIAGNEEAVTRMIDRGEVISIPNGTTVTVISRNGGSAQVEITTGDYNGIKVYTYVERLKKK